MSSGQVARCPFSTNVDCVGLKRAFERKPNTSSTVPSGEMELMVWVFWGLEVWTVVSSSSSNGTLHNPVVLSLYPDMMVVPSLATTILSLSKVMVHPWSAKTGREMSELPARVLNLYAVRAPGGRLGIFSSHRMLEVMCVPSGCVARMVVCWV